MLYQIRIIDIADRIISLRTNDLIAKPMYLQRFSSRAKIQQITLNCDDLFQICSQLIHCHSAVSFLRIHVPIAPSNENPVINVAIEIIAYIHSCFKIYSKEFLPNHRLKTAMMIPRGDEDG